MIGRTYTASTHWDAVASNYVIQTEKLTSQFVDPLLDAVAVGDGDRVLDVGCGPGAATFAASTRGATVTALDYSTEMLSILEARLGEQSEGRVALVEGDAQDLDFDDASFDVATSVFGVIFCPNVMEAIAEMRRVVRPGGRVGLSAWTSPSENSWPSLLPVNSSEILGFDVPTLSYFRWSSADQLGDALRSAGLDEVLVTERRGFGPTISDARRLRAVVASSPLNEANLGISTAQRELVADLIGNVAEERLATSGAFALPAAAWIASARVA